jgi:hypothetical protein
VINCKKKKRKARERVHQPEEVAAELRKKVYLSHKEILG